MSRAWFVRVAVVVSTVASILVPSFAAPARTISIPMTLARRVSLASWDERAVGAFGFRPTHVAFAWNGSRGGRVLYRTVTAGLASRWREAPEDPDLRAGRRHFTAVLEVPRPESVEFRRVVPAHGWMGSVTMDYLNTIDGPRVDVRVPATADAAATTPDIVTRREWGANESLKRTTGGCTRRFWPVQQLFVHHTAGINNDPHPYATMRAIYYFHVRTRGWCDVGYNFVIAPDGTVFEGRWARNYQPWETHDSEDLDHHGVQGAQVESFNAGSLGISMMGNYSEARLPAEARHSLEQVLAWEADRHELDPLGHHLYRSPESSVARWLPVIAGHRDAGDTACPGSHLYAELPSIRRSVAAIVGGGRMEPSLSLDRSALVRYPDRATVSGFLTHGSTGIPGEHVDIYARPHRKGWRLMGSGITQTDGSFSVELEVDRLTKLRAVFEGDHSYWGAESDNGWIRVAPHVELHAEGGTPDPTGANHYPQGTASIAFDGAVSPAHRKNYVTIRVAQADSSGTFAPLTSERVALDDASAFTYEFRVPDPAAGGTFRVTAWFPGDDDHAVSRSDRVVVIVDQTPV
ncbi:MAG: N-acetylmuramoyl-L-alanine amidase [Actinomycetota bacterium]|nr:N-acetylmuramoyl-L-alanine amidase [Actinomycetota bacterium]